jgi:predicted ribosomally synthesized peptide with nif11-like leader
MSAEGATALYERVTSDEEFRARLEAAETPEEKGQVVTEAGFDVSRDDLSTVRSLAGVSELSDEDLEKVAGGGATSTVLTVVEGAAPFVIIAAVSAL